MPAPLATAVRQAIIEDIGVRRLGRNEIARKHSVSPGVVTKIARAEHLYFENDWKTQVGSAAHRLDCELKRVQRENELLDDIMELPVTSLQRDGRETKAYRRLSYKLYDLQRHHA